MTSLLSVAFFLILIYLMCCRRHWSAACGVSPGVWKTPEAVMTHKHCFAWVSLPLRWPGSRPKFRERLEEFFPAGG